MSEQEITQEQQAAAANPISVMLVDDQALIRTGFKLIISSAPGFQVVAEADDGRHALAQLAELAARGELPAVVLMDVRMSGMDGIRATTEVTRLYPSVRVLILTTFDVDEYAMDAVRAGAAGFMLKDARAEELLRAVRAVAEGDQVLAPSVTRRLIERIRAGEGAGNQNRETGAAAPHAAPAVSVVQPAGIPGEGVPPASSQQTNAAMLPELAELTQREREVFLLIAEGLSNFEIGEKLFLSESTVKTHASKVLQKLGLRDRVHAVIYAYELGLRTPGSN